MSALSFESFLNGACRLRALPPALMLLSLGVLLSAQPKDNSVAGNPRGSPSGAAPPFDIHTMDPETFRAVAMRLSQGQSPRIDGKLDDEVWRLAPPLGNFIQREPDFGAPSTEKTEFRILYDDSRLYFGIWAYDDQPEGILASEMKRDSGLHRGDRVKINIDTFHDHRNGFYFATNPLGARKDANTVEDGRTINYDWNAVWQCKTSRDERGWYVEIAIPLSQLRFKSSIDETTWGLNLCRIIMRKNEETYWVPYPREWGAVGFARMSHAGVLTGLRDLRPRRRVEFVPFLTPQMSRNDAAGTPADKRTGYGFDLRVGLTSNLNSVLTYKTDFAQVEADQEIVNLTRFSLFFPEKREFFTRSAGVFDYGRTTTGFLGSAAADGMGNKAGLLTLFYSRRIGLHEGHEVPIRVGGKVTGRVGPYTLGVMNIETDQTHYLSDSGQEVLLPRANYSVLRAKRDILKKSTVGAIFLNRQGGAGADFNRTAGVDAGFYFGASTKLTTLLAKTFSPNVSGKDMAGAMDFSFKTDRFNYGTTYLDIGEQFNAEMGFIPRRDIRNGKLSAAWTPRPGWRGVRQLTIGAGVDYYANHAGRTESRNQSAKFRIQFQDSSLLELGRDRDYDFVPSDWDTGAGTIPAGGYRWDTWRVQYRSNRSRPVSAAVTMKRGGYYSGRKQTYRLNFNLLLAKTLIIESNYTRNQVRLPERSEYVTNTINTRVSYSLSPDLFLKTFLQYNDGRRLANFNFLLWYIYRPGSDLYIVYNQGWDTALPGPHTFHVRERSLAVKLTYWLSR